MSKVIVIGGGAAGLMAGVAAARSGADTIVLERMTEPGRKLLITGKGRCNLTNSCGIQELVKNLPGNGKFLFGALKRFGREELLDLLREGGLDTTEERGGRIFPASGKAMDVIRTFRGLLKSAGARLETGAQVTGLVMDGMKVKGVQFRRLLNDGRKAGQDYRSTELGKVKLGRTETLPADAVIVCTGGASYPGTGSDGNFFAVLEKLGIGMTPLLPALVPLAPEEGFAEDLDGLTLKNVQGTVMSGGKELVSEFGELQFTRGTVAGPISLTMSRKVAQAAAAGADDLELVLDLKPALDREKLDNRLQRDFAEFSKKKLKEVVRKLLPPQLVEPVLDTAYLDGEKQVSQVSREERRQLVEALKTWTIPLTGTRPLAEAIVTSGGVALKGIDPKTMASRQVEGLYFAGEVMDVDGYTGGYNLQAAFSSGYVAGQSAASAGETD